MVVAAGLGDSDLGNGMRFPPDDELLLSFESLGDNCEFGFVQRYFGVEPLGLLRFSWTSLDNLRRGLKERFSEILDYNNFSIKLAHDNEFLVNIIPYNFEYHSRFRLGQISEHRLIQEEFRRAQFLRRRILEDLQEGAKIFVRKSNAGETQSDMRALLGELQEFGPCKLLWVEQGASYLDAGLVEDQGGGLLRAWIDTFAAYTDVQSINVSAWIKICRAAYTLTQLGSTKTFSIQARERQDQEKNLLAGYLTAPASVCMEIVPHEDFCRQFDSNLGKSLISAELAGDFENQRLFTFRLEDIKRSGAYTISFWISFSDRSLVRRCEFEMFGVPTIRYRLWQPDCAADWQRAEFTFEVPDGVEACEGRFEIFVSAAVTARVTEARLERGILVEDKFGVDRKRAPNFTIKSITRDRNSTRTKFDDLGSENTPAQFELLHELTGETVPPAGVVFDFAKLESKGGYRVLVAACEVYLSIDFSGSDVGLVFDGIKSFGKRGADLGIRGRWQAINVSAILPVHSQEYYASLYLIGSRGCSVRSRNFVVYDGTDILIPI